jgi:hypothetical protein
MADRVRSGRAVARRLAYGGVAGWAGSLALWALLTVSRVCLPATLPPFRRDPGVLVVRWTLRRLPMSARARMPARLEDVARNLVAVDYGVLAGATYAAVRPRGGTALRAGPALRLVCWAVGYLGWLPACGLLPPPWAQRASALAGPLVHHLGYGVVTAAVYRRLQQRATPAGASSRPDANLAGMM